MKLYRNAIILIVIVALLVGAYFLVRNAKKTDDEQPDPAAQYNRLTDYLTDDIESVTLINKDGTFVIVKKDKDWVLSSPSDVKYDSSILSSIVINASTIVADKVVEENAADLTIYGLDDPAKAIIKTTDGKETVIEIGDRTPTQGGNYVKLAGSNKVYVISNFAGEKLSMGRNDLRSKSMFDGMTYDKIDSVAMSRKGSSLFSAKLEEDGVGWKMTAPIEGSVNETAISPMLEALSSTNIVEFVEEAPSDLSVYGLDKPSYEFEFSAEGRQYKLSLGDEKVKGSEIYAMLDGSNEVVTISMAPYNFLDKPLKEIIKIFAYIVNIDQVKSIDLTMNGKTDHMELDVYKDEEGNTDYEKDKFYFNGIDATAEDEEGKQPFRKLYQALIGIGLDEIDTEGKPEGPAEIIFDYRLVDGTRMKVEFISKDENFYYVVRNGEYAGILVKKRNKVDFGFEAVRQAYDNLIKFLDEQQAK
jgi:hypothetical protein